VSSAKQEGHPRDRAGREHHGGQWHGGVFAADPDQWGHQCTETELQTPSLPPG
jgi:hypothetical protein